MLIFVAVGYLWAAERHWEICGFGHQKCVFVCDRDSGIILLKIYFANTLQYWSNCLSGIVFCSNGTRRVYIGT